MSVLYINIENTTETDYNDVVENIKKLNAQIDGKCLCEHFTCDGLIDDISAKNLFKAELDRLGYEWDTEG